MRDISGMLREVYVADAVARHSRRRHLTRWRPSRGQFATDARAMVLRNGWFSYRWSQIFEAGGIPEEETVLMARRVGNGGAVALRAGPGRGGGGRDPRDASRGGLSPHMSRRAPASSCPTITSRGSRLRAHEVGRALRARLHRLGLRLGRHEGPRCRCADLGAAEGLVGLAVGGPRHAVRAGARTCEGAPVDEFLAVDLGKWLSIMEAYENGGPRLSRNHADRCAEGLFAMRCSRRGTMASSG